MTNTMKGTLASTLKSLVKQTLARFDIGIARYSRLQELIDFSHDVEKLSYMGEQRADLLFNLAKRSHSQLRQDLFVLSELDFRKGGYFVEFGATDGVNLSNTYLLEKEFEWNGILAEPAKCWHDELRTNRACHIDTNCVWSESDKILTFNEVESAELSTIDRYASGDSHRSSRERGQTYDVHTISLMNLLKKYDAPNEIDYISIDTEGSEYEILSKFDFAKYRFKVITCEHNFTPMRESIYKLLIAHGYRRKFFALSRFDDWYVSA